jgi:hypothetical protein
MATTSPEPFRPETCALTAYPCTQLTAKDVLVPAAILQTCVGEDGWVCTVALTLPDMGIFAVAMPFIVIANGVTVAPCVRSRRRPDPDNPDTAKVTE